MSVWKSARTVLPGALACEIIRPPAADNIGPEAIAKSVKAQNRSLASPKTFTLGALANHIFIVSTYRARARYSSATKENARLDLERLLYGDESLRRGVQFCM